LLVDESDKHGDTVVVVEVADVDDHNVVVL
jgi:hypothetical protein